MNAVEMNKIQNEIKLVENVVEKVKKEIVGVENGEVFESKYIQNLVKAEIDLVAVLEGKDIKAIIENDKILGLLVDGEVLVTTIGLALLKLKSNKDEFNKAVNRLANGKIELYKKGGAVYFRLKNENGEVLMSDKRLFVFNFKKAERMKKEVDKIAKLLVKEKVVRTSEPKKKEMKIVEFEL